MLITTGSRSTVRRQQLDGFAIGEIVRHRGYDGDFIVARIETHCDGEARERPFCLRAVDADRAPLTGWYGTYDTEKFDPYLWLAAAAKDIERVATIPAAPVLLRRDKIQAPLGALGVQPGWYCRWAGCDIWFEVLDVFDRNVRLVARDPDRKVDYAFVGDHFAAIDALINHRPQHGHWIDAFRNKNFYDKHHPEFCNMLS